MLRTPSPEQHAPTVTHADVPRCVHVIARHLCNNHVRAGVCVVCVRAQDESALRDSVGQTHRNWRVRRPCELGPGAESSRGDPRARSRPPHGYAASCVVSVTTWPINAHCFAGFVECWHASRRSFVACPWKLGASVSASASTYLPEGRNFLSLALATLLSPRSPQFSVFGSGHTVSSIGQGQGGGVAAWSLCGIA